MQNILGANKAQQALRNMQLVGTGGGAVQNNSKNYASPLAFFIDTKGALTSDDFAKIADMVTTKPTTNAYIEGRININTASAEVLACLPGISDTPDLAQTLVTYRQSNPDKLGTIAWLV